MTPEEMEKLADMIAARLMDTFAARLDMIEEVVFSESVSKLSGEVDSKTRILEMEILKQCDNDNGLKWIQIANNPLIHSLGVAISGDKEGSYSEFISNTISCLSSAGLLVGKKVSKFETSYKTNKSQVIF